MKYLMVDISGKVLNYDIALCSAISKTLPSKEKILLLAANIDVKNADCYSKRMVSLVPKSLQNSENKIKRSVKALEGIVNYAYLIFFVFLTRPSIIHFQWLPFLEVSTIERYFLQFLKIASRNSRLLLTIHNIFPHNCSEMDRERYKFRFAKVESFFDTFVLHLQTSKEEFCKEYKIDPLRCKVVPHGVFEPKNVKVTQSNHSEKLRLIMFGNQSFYKGTDILVDAVALLPKEIQNKFHTLIVGKIEPDYYAKLKDKSMNLDIEWIPHFISNEYLNQKINESDVIVLPYRRISQSGVLLLSLYFEKLIIVSDLPSFKETLEGCSANLFFESENPESLSITLSNLLDDKSIWDEYLFQLKKVKKNNLWEDSANKTIDCYNSLN